MGTIAMEDGGAIVDLVFGDGGDNLFEFDDCRALIRLLREPPERAHVLRIRARGGTFCLGRQPFPADPPARREAARLLTEVQQAMPASDLITVTEIQGAAAGFGVGLAAMSDVSIAAPAATFRFPEAAEGFAPTIVLSWLPRIIGERRAFDLAATARTFDAEEAGRLGLVTIVSDPDQPVSERTDTYVETLAGMPREVHRDIKGFLRSSRDLTRAQAFELATDRLVLGTLAAARGPDED